MECLWLQDGALSVRQIERPVPKAGEALVEVGLAGVCATDLELIRGYMPFTGVLGHELVGRVVTADADPAWVGRRVVAEINAACGSCPTCRAGRQNHCPNRTVLGISGLDGAFAELLRIPIANLHAVPDAISDEAAVFCEPLAAACRVTEQIRFEPGQRVALLGAGRLGQLIARVLAREPVELEVVARHAKQVALLARAGIEACGQDGLTDGWADVAVEATGKPAGFAQARRALRPGGSLVLKSTYAPEAGPPEVDFSGLVVDEITLVGSCCGPFDAALDLLASGEIDPTDLIEACYPLADAIEALDHAGRPGAMKILIQPGGSSR